MVDSTGSGKRHFGGRGDVFHSEPELCTRNQGSGPRHVLDLFLYLWRFRNILERDDKTLSAVSKEYSKTKYLSLTCRSLSSATDCLKIKNKYGKLKLVGLLDGSGEDPTELFASRLRLLLL